MTKPTRTLFRLGAALLVGCAPLVAEAQTTDTAPANEPAGSQHSAARDCVTAGTAGAVVALLPGFFTMFFDGGTLLIASIPIAAKAGTAACIGNVAGNAVADQMLSKK